MSEGEEAWAPISGRGGGVGSSSQITTREESYVAWDLRPGAGYRFKARARTVFGWSPEGYASDVISTVRRF